MSTPQNGVDSSRINKDAARAAMSRMPAPGQNRPGVDAEVFAQRQLQENSNPKTQQALPTAGPGSHPWIALGKNQSSTATTRKKIVIPPPHAY
ncbi:uncharacterized protein ACA1_052660 [Acanthamoeba castellanii str. Neff]|jgi:hypothetical protein|uniref:Uncharacterized protein n=1 Tax=Acanthamoeba castellanii (strain ATCC 30010 / Neff) TaxID=1257118 RepID=L8H606_ACACF|nr:uncharacterized protein ACA1_052660 [Acanthamoeba castellanii str. Neff]ELR20575.1 hypothetical protein ACA1_052660 [Acanthamoeba castellanii str. Neff]